MVKESSDSLCGGTGAVGAGGGVFATDCLSWSGLFSGGVSRSSTRGGAVERDVCFVTAAAWDRGNALAGSRERNKIASWRGESVQWWFSQTGQTCSGSVSLQERWLYRWIRQRLATRTARKRKDFISSSRKIKRKKKWQAAWEKRKN